MPPSLRSLSRLLPGTVRVPLRNLYRRIALGKIVPGEFDLDDALDWLVALRDSGIAFGFPEDLPSDPKSAFAILKHDIHQDLDRALLMAEAEHEEGISGIYFMMGPHDLNKTFYDSPRSWRQLGRIQELGHRIGLHLDVIDAVLNRGGLLEFVAQAVEQFAANGILLRYGNCHGNTKYISDGLTPRDFFEETHGEGHVTLTATSPLRELIPHLGKYSMRELGERFGLHYWLDARVRLDGAVQAKPTNVSDNSGAMQIPSLKISSRAFQIDEPFVRASVPSLSNKRSLILLHPQWYSIKQPEKSKAPALARTTSVSVRSPVHDLHVAPREHFDPMLLKDVSELARLGDSKEKVADFSVFNDGLRYDCRLNRRNAADHLIVALHGGVGGAKHHPVLARWTQQGYFKAPILSVFDPLIHEFPTLAAGWFVGDLNRDATAYIAEIARGVAAQLGIDSERVMFIGGSSGGFAAMRLACALGTGKFISLNGQSRIVRYYGRPARAFSGAFNPALSLAENAQRYERRWSAIPGLELALQTGTAMRGVVIQNRNDQHHFEKHYQPLCSHFGLPQEGGSNASGRLRAVLYEGEVKHGPETPQVARQIVRELIPELLR